MAKASLGATSPCFFVRDAASTRDFYRDQLGFEVRFEERAEGKPFFVIVGRDLTQIFLKSLQGITPVPNHTRHKWLPWDAFIYVEDPDALAQEFSSGAITFHAPLADTHDGLRGFAIADPDGYILFFGRPR